MTVCIAGMHRSGTSMVAQLLCRSGLDLGPPSELIRAGLENVEGYWENVHFVNLNDDILARRNGRWDLPPPANSGWQDAADLSDLKAKANELLKLFADRHPWGWKDPRNSLTLPFWKSLPLDTRVVVCVRHPMEVAHSLSRRGASTGIPWLQLWLEYYRSLFLACDLEERIVTHYESYFVDPAAELLRVARLLNLPASSEQVREAAATAAPALRHHRSSFHDLMHPFSPDVLRCYANVCSEAGPVFARSLEREPSLTIRPDSFVRIVQSSFADSLDRAKSDRRIATLMADRRRIEEDANRRLAEQRAKSLEQIEAGRNGSENGLAWKFAMKLRRFRRLVAPNGTWREKLFRWVFRAPRTIESNGKLHVGDQLNGVRHESLQGFGKMR